MTKTLHKIDSLLGDIKHCERSPLHKVPCKRPSNINLSLIADLSTFSP